MDKVVRRRLTDAVYLTVLRADRFKTGCLSVNLLTPHTRETAALNAVLPYVLRRGTARLPDMESLAAAMDGLYGARIEPSIRKKGETAAVGFCADFPDGAFLPDGTDILSETAMLLGEMLLDPATRGGRLRADYVESEREKLLEDIEAEINDKRAYAGQRLTEIMFRGESYGVSKLGTLAGARKVSVQTLTRHYKALLASAPVEIFYCGAEEPSRVERVVREALAALPRSGVGPMPVTKVLTADRETRPKTVREVMDVTQGRLVMGFRFDRLFDETDYPAMLVFNAAFGGSGASRLFLNVRERMALCYYISSLIDRQKGAMFVSAGIRPEDFSQTYDGVLRELAAIGDGGLEEWELDAARRAVVSSIYASLDDQMGLEAMYLDRAVSGTNLRPEELAALCSTVEAGAVRNVARASVLTHTFFLTAEEEHVEET